MQDLDLTSLFDNFDHQDSLAILFFMIIAFIFGFLVGYVLRSRKVRQLKKEIKQKKKELDEARIEINSLIEQLKGKDSTIQRLKYDVNEANARADRMDKDRSRFYNEAVQAKELANHRENELKEQHEIVEQLKEEIFQLNASNQALEAQQTHVDDEVNNLAQMQSVFLATKNRLETLEKRLSRVEQENDILQEQLKTQEAPAAETTEPSTPQIVDAPPIENEPEINLNQDNPVIAQKIEMEEVDKDDLTLIDGVGPFLEKQLNDLGIYTFAQLASVEERRVPELTRAIGHIPGRIERDKWIEQAQQLALNKSDHPDAFSQDRSIVTTPKAEDLTIIEGIGPKLESILNEAGVKNWNDLAEIDDFELRAILKSAGDAYQIIDPKTWPAQAQLAINGDWDLLKEYREELNRS